MSEAYAAAHIAQELGITVLADDVPNSGLKRPVKTIYDNHQLRFT